MLTVADLNTPTAAVTVYDGGTLNAASIVSDSLPSAARHARSFVCRARTRHVRAVGPGRIGLCRCIPRPQIADE